jgi:hypothetical protein
LGASAFAAAAGFAAVRGAGATAPSAFFGAESAETPAAGAESVGTAGAAAGFFAAGFGASAAFFPSSWK